MSVSRPLLSMAAALAVVGGCSAYGHAPNGTTQAADACTGAYALCKNSALQLVPPYDTSGPKDREIWPHADVIIEDAAKRAQKEAIIGMVQKDGRDTFKTVLGGHAYYLTTNSYGPITKAQLDALKDTASSPYPGYCAFYLYDEAMKFTTSYRIHVSTGHRATFCNAIIGVSGVAFHGQPALMTIAQYFYTGGPVAHTVSAIGADWIRTAALLPLKKEPDGTWVFTQDTSCFPLTNTIDTLAKAKAHLMTCQARPPHDKAPHEP